MRFPVGANFCGDSVNFQFLEHAQNIRKRFYFPFQFVIDVVAERRERARRKDVSEIFFVGVSQRPDFKMSVGVFRAFVKRARRNVNNFRFLVGVHIHDGVERAVAAEYGDNVARHVRKPFAVGDMKHAYVVRFQHRFFEFIDVCAFSAPAFVVDNDDCKFLFFVIHKIPFRYILSYRKRGVNSARSTYNIMLYPGFCVDSDSLIIV